MDDPVGQAIAAADQVVKVEPRTIRIASTGRLFMFALPPDVTDAEIFEVVGWMATQYRFEQAARREASDPASRLWTPGSKPTLVRPT